MWTLFVVAEAAGLALSETERSALAAAVGGIGGLAHARIMVADRTEAEQPFAADGAGPELVLQLYFADRESADAVLGAGSPLARLAPLTRLSPDRVAHQLMKARVFATGAQQPASPHLTFLVTYPGPAADPPRWLDHYDANHPPIMVRFPGIREVETYRPAAWSSALPFVRGEALQRNKVVFASLADLLAALASPVMAEMRADSRTFPPFSGRTTHLPMTTWVVPGGGRT